jgi:hypothetical protein
MSRDYRKLKVFHESHSLATASTCVLATFHSELVARQLQKLVERMETMMAEEAGRSSPSTVRTAGLKTED